MSAHVDQAQPPRLAIVAGDPSAEEVAAVVAVLSVLLESAGAPGAGETVRYGWSDRSRLLREPLARGTGGWRASALPR